jgi:hypothetical protein
MLMKMLAPCRIAIDEEFEVFKGNNDCRHIISSFMKKCEDMAIGTHCILWLPICWANESLSVCIIEHMWCVPGGWTLYWKPK